MTIARSELTSSSIVLKILSQRLKQTNPPLKHLDLLEVIDFTSPNELFFTKCLSKLIAEYCNGNFTIRVGTNFPETADLLLIRSIVPVLLQRRTAGTELTIHFELLALSSERIDRFNDEISKYAAQNIPMNVTQQDSRKVKAFAAWQQGIKEEANGNVVRALTLYKEAIIHDKTNIDYLFASARLCSKVPACHDIGLMFLNEIVELHPAHPNRNDTFNLLCAYQLQANIYSETFRLPKALACYHKQFEIVAQSAEKFSEFPLLKLLNLVVELEFQLGNYDEAINYASKVTDDAEENLSKIQILVYKVRALFHLQRHSMLWQNIEELEAQLVDLQRLIDPPSAPIEVKQKVSDLLLTLTAFKGTYALLLGNYQDALEYFAKAAANNASAAFGLLFTQLLLNQPIENIESVFLDKHLQPLLRSFSESDAKSSDKVNHIGFIASILTAFRCSNASREVIATVIKLYPDCGMLRRELQHLLFVIALSGNVSEVRHLFRLRHPENNKPFIDLTVKDCQGNSVTDLLTFSPEKISCYLNQTSAIGVSNDSKLEENHGAISTLIAKQSKHTFPVCSAEEFMLKVKNTFAQNEMTAIHPAMPLPSARRSTHITLLNQKVHFNTLSIHQFAKQFAEFLQQHLQGQIQVIELHTEWPEEVDCALLAELSRLSTPIIIHFIDATPARALKMADYYEVISERSFSVQHNISFTYNIFERNYLNFFSDNDLESVNYYANLAMVVSLSYKSDNALCHYELAHCHFQLHLLEPTNLTHIPIAISHFLKSLELAHESDLQIHALGYLFYISLTQKNYSQAENYLALLSNHKINAEPLQKILQLAKAGRIFRFPHTAHPIFEIEEQMKKEPMHEPAKKSDSIAAANNPPDEQRLEAGALFQEIFKLFQSADYEVILKKLSVIAKKYPKRPDILLPTQIYKIHTLILLNAFNEAKQIYHQALSLLPKVASDNPDKAYLHIYGGFIALAENKLSKAQETFELASQIGLSALGQKFIVDLKKGYSYLLHAQETFSIDKLLESFEQLDPLAENNLKIMTTLFFLATCYQNFRLTKISTVIYLKVLAQNPEFMPAVKPALARLFIQAVCTQDFVSIQMLFDSGHVDFQPADAIASHYLLLPFLSAEDLSAKVNFADSTLFHPLPLKEAQQLQRRSLELLKLLIEFCKKTSLTREAVARIYNAVIDHLDSKATRSKFPLHLAELSFYLGECLFADKLYEPALRQFKKTNDLFPQHSQVKQYIDECQHKLLIEKSAETSKTAAAPLRKSKLRMFKPHETPVVIAQSSEYMRPFYISLPLDLEYFITSLSLKGFDCLLTGSLVRNAVFNIAGISTRVTIEAITSLDALKTFFTTCKSILAHEVCTTDQNTLRIILRSQREIFIHCIEPPVEFFHPASYVAIREKLLAVNARQRDASWNSFFYSLPKYPGEAGVLYDYLHAHHNLCVYKANAADRLLKEPVCMLRALRITQEVALKRPDLQISLDNSDYKILMDCLHIEMFALQPWQRNPELLALEALIGPDNTTHLLSQFGIEQRIAASLLAQAHLPMTQVALRR